MLNGVGSARALVGSQVKKLLEAESKLREKEQELRQQEEELAKQELRLQSSYVELEQNRNEHIAALERWAAEKRHRELKEPATAQTPKTP